jgi:hypothetical protein
MIRCNNKFVPFEIDLFLNHMGISVNQTDDQFIESMVNAGYLAEPDHELRDLIIEPFHKNPTAAALTIMYEGGGIIMRFKNFDPVDPIKLGYVAHEALHATSFMLNSKNIIFNDDTEEVYAYTLGYITSLFYKEMFKWIS